MKTSGLLSPAGLIRFSKKLCEAQPTQFPAVPGVALCEAWEMSKAKSQAAFEILLLGITQ